MYVYVQYIYTCCTCLNVGKAPDQAVGKKWNRSWFFFFSTLRGSPLYLHPTIYLFLLHEIFCLHFKWQTTGLALEPVWCWSAGHFTPNSIGWLVGWLVDTGFSGSHTVRRSFQISFAVSQHNVAPGVQSRDQDIATFLSLWFLLWQLRITRRVGSLRSEVGFYVRLYPFIRPCTSLSLPGLTSIPNFTKIMKGKENTWPIYQETSCRMWQWERQTAAQQEDTRLTATGNDSRLDPFSVNQHGRVGGRGGAGQWAPLWHAQPSPRWGGVGSGGGEGKQKCESVRRLSEMKKHFWTLWAGLV